ncbi:MAG: hypothetical protein PHV32_05735 [Eubacteriales bacterium]|nr:hypothetical protein [Eubacteriales bacterium]
MKASMKDFVSKSLKATVDYLIVLAFYFIALIPFLMIFKDNANNWIWLYSLLLFILLFRMLFHDYHKIGAFEKRTEDKFHPYLFKGFLLGVTGMIPIVLLGAINLFINIEDQTVSYIVDYAFKKVLFGPLYFIPELLTELGRDSYVTYLLSTLVVPIITFTAYTFGYHDLYLFPKKSEQAPDYKAIRAKSMSPWNPSYKKENGKEKK